MKFMTIIFQVEIEDFRDRTVHDVRVEMTMGDDATPNDAAAKFGAALQHKLETVNIGDYE